MEITKNIFGEIYKYQRDIQVILLCSIAFTIPFSISLGNIALILCSIFNLFIFKTDNFKKLTTYKASFLFLVFFVAAGSSFLSKDVLTGLNHLDLILLIVLIALIFLNTKINDNIVEKLLKWFYTGVIFSTLILLLHSVVKLLNGANLEDIVFHGFTLLFDQHPVYFSMYCSFALFIGLSRFHSRKPLNVIMNVILIGGILMSASKAVIAISFIMIFIFHFSQLTTLKSKLKVTALSIMVGFAILNISFIEERAVRGIRFSKEILDFEPTNDFTDKHTFNYLEKSQISDLELRFLLIKIGLYHFIQDNKLYLGYGQGDLQMYLDYYYFSYNLGPNWFEGINVHNQYLHILLMYGLFFLLLFLYYLIYSFWLAIIHKNIYHQYFFILCLFVFIFEVVLVRNKGIIFFYFINSLFLFSYSKLENSNIRKPRNT